MFFIFRSGPDFQIWVSNLIFTSYFNSSFNFFLSNCWFLVFGFLQDSAVTPKFWTFFSANYCFFLLSSSSDLELIFFKSRFRPGIKLFKSRFIWIPGLNQTLNWEAEFQVYFKKSRYWCAILLFVEGYTEGQNFLDARRKPKIRQFTIWYAGSLGRWDKQIVNQSSDVPNIIFFMISCKILCKNPFNLFSYFLL